jgi:HlyD family secretion protein
MPSSPRKGFGPILAVVVVLAAAGGAGWWFLAPGTQATDAVPTFKVVRGPLRISVTEGGSLQSLKSAVIASDVEGSTKIVAIIPEGTTLTAEDVAQGRTLVELDSSEIRTKLNRQEISVSDALASLAQSAGALDIQLNQNASDIRKADLDVRFARLDLDKYLGASVAGKALASRNAEGRRVLPDVRTLAEDATLEGEALQEERKLKSEIDLSDEEVSRARDKLAGTEKLLAKGYVSQDELVADRLALKRQEVALDQAKTALSLFLTYSFPKQVEKLWSDLLEAEETLARVKKQADSSRTQAEADRKGKEEKLRLEKDQFEKLERQLAACVIKATTPGLVVYASSEDRGDWRDGQPIQAGTSVREREAIISIPDPKLMGVKVNVHESALDKVKVGQAVVVIVDAFADRPLAGRIERLATLPSGANRWQNPDLKLYPTDIVLDDPPANLRPGMSARVEILVKDLESTLAVPVQAIGYLGGKPTIWVRRDASVEPRPARLGLANDRFTEVLDGVADGDVVSLAPPKESKSAAGSSDRRGPKGGPKSPGAAMGEAPAMSAAPSKGPSDAGPSAGSTGGAGAPAPAAAPATSSGSPTPTSVTPARAGAR